DLDGHVRELELDRLEGRDRLPELMSLERVGAGEIVGALGEPDAHRRDRDPAPVEDLEELPEPPPALAEQVRLRHRAPLEGELAGVRGTPPELVHRRRDLVPG